MDICVNENLQDKTFRPLALNHNAKSMYDSGSAFQELFTIISKKQS